MEELNRLGEIGDALSGIRNSVKSLKMMQENAKEINRVTEEAKKHSEEIENYEFPAKLKELNPKLDKLKHAIKEIPSFAIQLEGWFKDFGVEIADYANFLRENTKDSTIPHKVLMELCRKLEKIHGMDSEFFEAFKLFNSNLSKAQQVATELADQLKKKVEDLEEKARSRTKLKDGAIKANKISADVAGVGVLSTGAFLALGFFTGGVGWLVGAGVAAGVAGVAGATATGAGVVAVVAKFDSKILERQADGILSHAKKLGMLATKLRLNSDQVGKIKLDKEATREALRTALELYKNDQDKDEQIARQKATIDEKEAENRELREQVRKLKRG